MLKVSSCYIYNIYIIVLGQTDFEHPIFSIIPSQSCFIEMDLLWKMLLLLRHKKNYIYSKLVNNFIKHLYLYSFPCLSWNLFCWLAFIQFFLFVWFCNCSLHSAVEQKENYNWNKLEVRNAWQWIVHAAFRLQPWCQGVYGKYRVLQSTK